MNFSRCLSEERFLFDPPSPSVQVQIRAKYSKVKKLTENSSNSQNARCRAGVDETGGL
jgi:hypothetical protein